MKRVRRVKFDRAELFKMKKRIADLRLVERNINSYIKSVSPKQSRVKQRKQPLIPIEIKKDRNFIQKLIKKNDEKKSINFKLPSMRGKQIRLEEGNLNNLKSKYEDVKNDKLDLSVNTTQNRNKQRNVNILSNQYFNQTAIYSDIQNKLISKNKNKNRPKDKRRMLSPFQEAQKLISLSPSTNYDILNMFDTNATNSNNSLGCNRYLNSNNKFNSKERESIVPDIVMNYINEENIIEKKSDKRRNFYKNIKESKGKYSTFFEELTKSQTTIQDPNKQDNTMSSTLAL